ncbi:hypothetical protein RND71_017976 [Anisodus tanguticus]|uniref:Uncharacterized protein n=1 Tax=Anisodus tanguticus TaxID=243964 RepID=A0AAE1S3H0_9SOLA|nr:hypothetical protein RND71_017976 [Anisodus tanguticus]
MAGAVVQSKKKEDDGEWKTVTFPVRRRRSPTKSATAPSEKNAKEEGINVRNFEASTDDISTKYRQISLRNERDIDAQSKVFETQIDGLKEQVKVVDRYMQQESNNSPSANLDIRVSPIEAAEEVDVTVDEMARKDPSAEASPIDNSEASAEVIPEDVFLQYFGSTNIIPSPASPVGVHEEQVEEFLDKGIPTSRQELHALRTSLFRLSKEARDSPALKGKLACVKPSLLANPFEVVSETHHSSATTTSLPVDPAVQVPGDLSTALQDASSRSEQLEDTLAANTQVLTETQSIGVAEIAHGIGVGIPEELGVVEVGKFVTRIFNGSGPIIPNHCILKSENQHPKNQNSEITKSEFQNNVSERIRRFKTRLGSLPGEELLDLGKGLQIANDRNLYLITYRDIHERKRSNKFVGWKEGNLCGTWRRSQIRGSDGSNLVTKYENGKYSSDMSVERAKFVNSWDYERLSGVR